MVADVKAWCRLLPWPHVQFWETENSGRLDRAHRWSRRSNIPCLVDASDVRAVNAQNRTPARRRSYFFAALIFAQRFRCAAAIRFRPAAEMVLFFGAGPRGGPLI